MSKWQSVYTPSAPELGLGLGYHCKSHQSVVVIEDMGVMRLPESRESEDKSMALWNTIC